MATQTWYINQLNVGGTNPNRLWYDLSSGAAAVAQTTSASGWVVGKTGAGNYANLVQGVIGGTFSTTIVPNATAPTVDNSYAATAVYTPPTLLNSTDSISTLYEYNGYFPSGTWTFNFPVIATVGGGAQDGNIGIRIFKGLRSGTAWASVTELTSPSARLAGTTVTNVTTTTAQTTTVTWAGAPIIQLNNEFLIIKVGWQISGAGGANNSNLVLRYGQGCTMISPTFKARTRAIT